MIGLNKFLRAANSSLSGTERPLGETVSIEQRRQTLLDAVGNVER
jgi:hypothetical protein